VSHSQEREIPRVLPACMRAVCVQFKSFFYRCFDGDSPLAGLSGHAYECYQMKALYSLASPFEHDRAKHLLCVDELGKGTDDASATALCCSTLQLFDAVRTLCSVLTLFNAICADALALLQRLALLLPLRLLLPASCAAHHHPCAPPVAPVAT
jgi:hypothetical protein